MVSKLTEIGWDIKDRLYDLRRWLNKTLLIILAVLAFLSFLLALGIGISGTVDYISNKDIGVFQVVSIVVGFASLTVMLVTFYAIFLDIRLRNRPFIYFGCPNMPSFGANQAPVILTVTNCGTLRGMVTRLYISYDIDLEGLINEKNQGVVTDLKVEITLYPNETFTKLYVVPRDFTKKFCLVTNIEYENPTGQKYKSNRSWVVEKRENEFKQLTSDET